jgi:hypothetical protein
MSYLASSTAGRWAWVGEGATGTRTVTRADTLRPYAEESGFSTCEVLPIRP